MKFFTNLIDKIHQYSKDLQNNESVEYYQHLHEVTKMSVRGKNDSVNIYCWCGKEGVWADWYDGPLNGWTSEGHEDFKKSVEYFLDSWKGRFR